MRRLGDAPKNGKRYRLRPGAYAVLPRGEAILVTHQIEPQAEFQLPGGGIDPGESPTAALYREVYEETGWRIARPRRMGAFRRFAWLPEYEKFAEKVCHIYLATPVRRLSDPTEPGHTAHWMPIDLAVGHLGNPGDRFWMQRLLQSGKFDQRR